MAECLPHPMETPVKLLFPLCSSVALPKAFETPARNATGEGACSRARGPAPVRSAPSGHGTAKEAAARHRPPPSQGRGPLQTLPASPFFTSSLWMVLWQLGSFYGSWGSGGSGTPAHGCPWFTGSPANRYPNTQVPQSTGTPPLPSTRYPSTQTSRDTTTPV